MPSHKPQSSHPKPPPPSPAKPAAPSPAAPPPAPSPAAAPPASSSSAGPAPLRPVKPAPEPAANPIHGLPPPELPPKNRGGRPRKDGTPAQPRTPATSGPATSSPASPPPPPDGPRELPTDAELRAKALESVSGEVKLALSLLDVGAERLPPFMPLTPIERISLEGPLAEVIWKYTGTLSPEWKLASALGGIAFVRFMEWRSLSPEAQEGAKLAARAKLAGAGAAA